MAFQPARRQQCSNVETRNTNFSRHELSMIAIVNIGQLVTLAGPARPRVGAELRDLAVIIKDAAILIDDRPPDPALKGTGFSPYDQPSREKGALAPEGRIFSVGSYAELKSEISPDATIIDAEHRCVTPGFVDAHTHLVFAGNRAAEFEQRIAGATYQEIAAAGGGILSTVALTREAATEDDLLARLRACHRDWMLRGGWLHSRQGQATASIRETELKMLRVLRELVDEGPVRIVPTLLAAHTVPPECKDHGRRVRSIHLRRADS